MITAKLILDTPDFTTTEVLNHDVVICLLGMLESVMLLGIRMRIHVYALNCMYEYECLVYSNMPSYL